MAKLTEYTFKKFIFVVTGMSYIIDSSGTSNVVKAHEEIFKAHGIGYIAIFPISRSGGEGVNWHVKTTGCYAFVIDGQFIAVKTANEVLNSLLELQRGGKTCIGVLIHHIIRNDIREVQWLLEKICNTPVVYHLHDFFTCCPNPNMLKNDAESCIDGGVSCSGCAYAEKRVRHLSVINSFLHSFGSRITFVAPSEYVKCRWLSYYPEYANRVMVIPHLKSNGQYTGNRESVPDSEPIRLGFVGTQTNVKGWNIYKRTVAKLQEANCHYEYYYFGHGKETLPNVTNIHVETATMGKNAMTRALQERRISAVFLVSICSETYSYTMYESHAANSYILTINSSGNIAHTVAGENWGRVYKTEADLTASLLDEAGFRNTVNAWKHNSIPGAASYEDNDEIVKLYSLNGVGFIKWNMKSTSIRMRIKRLILNAMFIQTRLKRGMAK